MQKGYKRTGKAIAVLHFFIGLIVVAILLGVAYFFLQKMDYSGRLSPDTTMRPYVEMTASPYGEEPDPTEPVSNNIVDLTPTDTPEPTPESTPTPEPTPIPSPTPEPTATPEPTPAPTAIPADKLSKYTMDGFVVPPAASNITAQLTNIYVSQPDNNATVVLDGYAYIDDSTFDGATANYYLIVTQASSGRQIAYQAAKVAGVSGVSHDNALCLHADSTDFEVVLQVKDFSDGEYKLGVVMMYTRSGGSTYSYHEFEDTLTVRNKAIALATEAFADAAAQAEEGEDAEGAEIGFEDTSAPASVG